MGLATSFLQGAFRCRVRLPRGLQDAGSREEWSLVRRHPSEGIFGVQLCGNKPTSLVSAAEAIARECGPNIDFVDVNCGCPIDLVFTTGAGSARASSCSVDYAEIDWAAVLDAPTKLSKIVVGMSNVLGDIPVTIKLRTGVKDGKNTAHKLMPRLPGEFGVGAVTVRPLTLASVSLDRSSRRSMAELVSSAIRSLRTGSTSSNAPTRCDRLPRTRTVRLLLRVALMLMFSVPTIPIFGGGDCYSYESYSQCMEESGVDGIMIGRGALIKPWIFTEIKEQREWDISSRERLEFVRQYCEFGLTHFGSDTSGVNTTRRFVCEALSFQYRYIPLGLLERLPGQLNERPPGVYRGRDELETLLASDNVKTWVSISEMFLGKAPEDWVFTPKHKSNAYGSEEGQG